jgi:hypothetical protein
MVHILAPYICVCLFLNKQPGNIIDADIVEYFYNMSLSCNLPDETMAKRRVV